MFNNILVDLAKVIMFTKNDLKMDIARVSPLDIDSTAIQAHYWIPLPKGYLKMNVNVGFKDGSGTLIVFTRDKMGKV